MNVIGIKMFLVTLFSLKFNIPYFFDFDKIFVLNVYPDTHSPKKPDETLMKSDTVTVLNKHSILQ
jgi:hypothetical protein